MKTSQYITLAVLALGFAACSQDDDFAPQDSDIVKIASVNIATEVQSRVNTLGDGKTFENTDRILLVNGSRDNKNSGTYTYNGTAWSLTDGMVLYASSGTNDFTAYYPANVDFTLPTNQSTEANIKSADRMVATATGVGKEETVELSFERQNAKITITPEVATEFTGKSISSMTIADVTPYQADGATDYTAIIEPTDNGFTVSVIVDGQSLNATTATKIEAGKHYTFSLTVGKVVMTISDVSVQDWTSGTITGSETKEILGTSISGTTAKISVNGAAADDIQAAVANALAEGCTTLEIYFKENTAGGITDGIANAIDNQENKIDLILTGSVTSIPNLAFHDCSNLKSISLPEGITSIGNNVFSGCSSLSSISLPASLTSIGSNPFVDLPSLTNIEVNEASETYKDIDGVLYSKDGTTLICYPAGKETTKLPDGITRIENFAFYGCSNLTSIKLPDGVTNIGINAFYNCSSLETITLPNSVTTIGFSAFKNCSNLEAINIPDGVTVIDYYTFEGCALKTITIPASVTVIVDYAFYGCSSLAEVVCKHECKEEETDHPQLGSYSFSHCAEDLKIYVPASSVDSYKKAWSTYKDKIVAISEE